MNKCYLKENKIWFSPIDGDDYEVCEVKDANFEEGCLLVGNMAVYPFHESEFEIVNAWKELFPNGRPIPEITVKKVYSEMDMLWDAIAVMNGVEVRPTDV